MPVVPTNEVGGVQRTQPGQRTVLPPRPVQPPESIQRGGGGTPSPPGGGNGLGRGIETAGDSFANAFDRIDRRKKDRIREQEKGLAEVEAAAFGGIMNGTKEHSDAMTAGLSIMVQDPDFLTNKDMNNVARQIGIARDNLRQKGIELEASALSRYTAVISEKNPQKRLAMRLENANSAITNYKKSAEWTHTVDDVQNPDGTVNPQRLAAVVSMLPPAQALHSIGQMMAKNQQDMRKFGSLISEMDHHQGIKMRTTQSMVNAMRNTRSAADVGSHIRGQEQIGRITTGWAKGEERSFSNPITLVADLLEQAGGSSAATVPALRQMLQEFSPGMVLKKGAAAGRNDITIPALQAYLNGSLIPTMRGIYLGAQAGAAGEVTTRVQDENGKFIDVPLYDGLTEMGAGLTEPQRERIGEMLTALTMLSDTLSQTDEAMTATTSQLAMGEKGVIREWVMAVQSAAVSAPNGVVPPEQMDMISASIYGDNPLFQMAAARLGNMVAGSQAGIANTLGMDVTVGDRPAVGPPAAAAAATMNPAGGSPYGPPAGPQQSTESMGSALPRMRSVPAGPPAPQDSMDDFDVE